MQTMARVMLKGCETRFLFSLSEITHPAKIVAMAEQGDGTALLRK
jgi:hypothetical protein